MPNSNGNCMIMQRIPSRLSRLNCIWRLPIDYIPKSARSSSLRRSFTACSTPRQAHGGPTGPSSKETNGGSQTTHEDNTSTWKKISSNPSYRKAVIITVIVVDVGYGFAIYNTGGLDESPLSPYRDPTFRWLFPRQPKEPLHPNEFRTFVLLDKERISETSSILTLQPARTEPVTGNLDPYAKFWEKGIWSVEIKQPQLQIARRYTPLPHTPQYNENPEDSTQNPPQTSEPQDHTTSENLTLLVRRDPTGEVSNYLHRLPVGAKLDIRGGYIEYELPKDVTEVLFLAGGTGIAPALQIAHTLAWRYVHKDNDGAGMRILWANRHQEECSGGVEYTSASTNLTPRPLKSMMPASPPPPPPSPPPMAPTPPQNTVVPNALVRALIDLEESNTCLRLSTTYFIDTAHTFITLDSILDALTTLSTPPGEASTRAQGRKLVFVSGPDGFVEYLTGPRRFWNGVEERGVTGGVLGGVDLRGWEVVRL